MYASQAENLYNLEQASIKQAWGASFGESPIAATERGTSAATVSVR